MSTKPSEGPQTNAAIRLHNLLSMLPKDGTQYANWLLTQQPVFLGEGIKTEIRNNYRVLLAIHGLLDTYQKEVDQSGLADAQKQVLLKVIRPLRGFFSPMSLTDRMTVLDADVRVSLQYSLAFLNSSPSLSEEDLDGIKAAIKGLEELLAEADISPVLRSTLQELVRLANDAIIRFRIYGADGLRKQFRAMVGETAMLLQELHGTQLNKPEDISAMKLMKHLVNSVGKSLKKMGAYKDGVDLMGGIVKLLGGGDGGD